MSYDIEVDDKDYTVNATNKKIQVVVWGDYSNTHMRDVDWNGEIGRGVRAKLALKQTTEALENLHKILED